MARCPHPCLKIRFMAEHIAQLACIRAAMRGDPHLVWYRADDCHCWHLCNPQRRGRGAGGRRGQWVHTFTDEAVA